MNNGVYIYVRFKYKSPQGDKGDEWHYLRHDGGNTSDIHYAGKVPLEKSNVLLFKASQLLISLACHVQICSKTTIFYDLKTFER